MISKFAKIMEDLYRGGKPSKQDVIDLKNNYNIKKIISLDGDCGVKIEDVCKKLGIKHYIIDLDGSKQSLINLFKHDLNKLLLENGPTFIHCMHGKDRTGMLAAVAKIKFLGMFPQEALKEAEKFGFGIGVDEEYIKPLKDIILSTKSNTDENFATIVSNQRDEGPDLLDSANIKSFAPPTVYPDRLEQDFSRDQLLEHQRDINEVLKPHNYKNFPQSGVHEIEKDLAGAGFIFASKSNNMKKWSYTLDMSYKVTDLEKQKADQAVLCFDQVIKNMYKASEYLDLIKEPFEKDSNMKSEDILNIRSQLRSYRDEALNKFNIFKASALKCLNVMETFSSDTQTLKLIKVFISSIEEIEENVNKFMEIFSSLEDPEFAQNVIKYSNEIQTLCNVLEDIIYNRLVKHIKSNILATNWVDSISNKNV